MLQDGRSAYCCVCGDAGVWVRGGYTWLIALEVRARLSCLRSGGEKGGRSRCVVELMATYSGEGDGQFWTARLLLLRLRDWGMGMCLIVVARSKSMAVGTVYPTPYRYENID